MRQFVVSEAPVSRVAQHVRDTVEDDGGIVAHHTSRKTEFDHLEVTDKSWRRAGYVGTYQRFKEKPVQVRIRVWAQWPRRLLAGSIYLGFALALVFFLASIIEVTFPPNVWIFTALPILAVIAAAFLMYTSSITDSEAVERRLEAELVDRLNEDDEVPGEVYDLDEWTEYREAIVEEARDEARAEAPDGGSGVRRILADASLSMRSLGSDEEETPAEAESATEQPEQAAEDEADDEGRLASLTAKLGLGGEEGDDGSEDDGETSEDEEPGFVTRWKAKLGLGSSDDEETSDEPDVEGSAEPEETSGAAAP